MKRGLAILLVILFLLGGIYALRTSNFFVQNTGFGFIDTVLSMIRGPPSCTAGYKCYSATVLGYQNRKCKWSNLHTCPSGCINNACVFNTTCQEKFSCSGNILVHQLTDCTNLTQNCPFGCANNACNPDPCTGITCPDVCKDANNINMNGNCAAGSCQYTAVPCTYGCANNACKTDPCAGISCPNICQDSTTLKINGQCVSGVCQYNNQSCPYGCANGACNTPPPSNQTITSDRVQIFYYPWYGNTATDGRWIHWGQNGHSPPDDIGSNFYPQLGPYSSADRATVAQHMTWIHQAGIGVIVYSWWGQSSRENQLAGLVLEEANKQGVKIAWHMEPYSGRSAASVVADIKYIYNTYGSYPAFYKVSRPTKYGNTNNPRGAFYVFESSGGSGVIPAADWRTALDSLHSDTIYNAIVIGQGSNACLIDGCGNTTESHFDGLYTYDGLQVDGSGFANSNTQIKSRNSIFAPSVAPGYVASRATTDTRVKARYNSSRAIPYAYDSMWDYAIKANTEWVSITSFNEWHEGSQIEPAMPKTISGYTYEDYNDFDANAGSDLYLVKTLQNVQKFTGVSSNVYYVDSVAGNDANSGTSQSQAWQTLTKANNANLKPGNSLLLKRGSSWTGPLKAKWNGTSAQPILISVYGTGNLPFIKNSDSTGEVVQITGRYQIIEYLEVSSDPPPIRMLSPSYCPPGTLINGQYPQPVGWRVGFKLANTASYNTIRYSKAQNQTAGIHIALGSHHNKVLNNILTQNNYVSVLTQNGTSDCNGIMNCADDDAGAAGIILNGDDNEIAYNTFSYHEACTFDYGPDGISIEVYKAHGNFIHHNTAYNDLSFAELGGDNLRKAEDTTIAYNKFVNYLNIGTGAVFLNTRGAGQSWGPTWRTKAYNNVVYITDSKGQGVICSSGCNGDILSLKNNIIVSNWKGIYADASFEESNNIIWNTTPTYFQTQGPWTLSATSKRIDPQFVNPAANDFHLQSTSPAIDAGIDLGYSTDLDGNSVPYGNATDIGAYESRVIPTQTDPILVGAGDIGSITGNGDELVAQVLDSIFASNPPGVIFTAGDNVNEAYAPLEYYLSYFDPTWGRHKSVIRPAPGNHDFAPFLNGSRSYGTGFFDYYNGVGIFTGPAGDRDKGYYSYNLGSWHIIVINSVCNNGDACGSGTTQQKWDRELAWLNADLDANTQNCIAAYWHHPLFSSGQHGNQVYMKPIWEALYAHGADIVMNGHSHDYERFAMQDPNGAANPNGIREFVVGTGGRIDTQTWNITNANSEVRADGATGANGVLKLTLHSSGYSWQFVPVAGKTFSDSGTAPCHGAPSDTAPPTAPTNLVATAVNGNRVDLTWTASTDNVGVAGYKIFRDGVQIGTSATTSYIDTSVQSGTTYSYYVIAYDFSNNNSPQSNTATLTTPQTQTLTFTTTADAYLDYNLSGSNFGSDASLKVDGSPITNIILKFSVSGINSMNVISAKLRLYTTNPSVNGGDIYRVINNNWDENTVTWSNSPSSDSTSIASLGSVTTGTWSEADVTSVVQSDGTESFKIKSTSSDGAWYSSKEGANAPQLVITTS